MHHRIYSIRGIFLFFLTLLMFSCQEENENAVILLTPFELYINTAPSQVVVININCRSPMEMRQLVIKSRLEGDFSKTELDTIISGKDFFMQFEYLVPAITENAKIILEFYLTDASNVQVTNFRVINVETDEIYLTETAGHELFSGNSGKQNGYNLVLGTPLFSHLADTSDLHIADTTNSEILLNRWISPAGVKFVRFNGFDYANCTNISTRAAYNAGLKTDFLDKITEGDIYISKIQNTDQKDIYIAIKIVDVIDKPGSESDRYVFNIKK